jgi:hypothetical protein
MAGALNNDSAGLGEHADDALGTGLGTKATTDTSNGVNLSNAVLGIDVNSILGTNSHTIAVTKTSVGTLGVTGIGGLSRLTGLNTVVNVLSVLCLALTVTSNVSYLCSNVTCSETTDLGNLSSNLGAAGNTESRVIALALTESLCITVTARVTASTAVCSGETITNSNNLLVFLNCEEGSGKSKNDSANKRNNNKNY